MLRAIVFMDHMNFYKATHKLYQDATSKEPKLDYNILPSEIVKKADINATCIKSFIFAPKPDDFLNKDPFYANYYEWVDKTLKKMNFLDVIEGQYLARPTDEKIPMDINDKKTYYPEEKGTDINLAVNMLSMAYHNSFDVAVIASGDSDYSLLLEQVKRMGKLIVVASVKGQNITRLAPYKDKTITLDEKFFDLCALGKKM